MPHNKIEWSEKLTTQIRSLDDHHVELIDQLNEFSSAVSANMSVPGLQRLFNRIIEDVQHHFAVEEQVLLNIGFNDYSEHKKHHAALLSDAMEIAQDLLEARTAKDIEPSIAFLNALIVKHMVQQDKKISEHITQGLGTSIPPRETSGTTGDNIHLRPR